MAGENDDARPGKPFRPGPAAISQISLSQAILAPLDALAKAQVHAARSFLNFVLQIGYPHRSGPRREDAAPEPGESLYCESFQIAQGTNEDGSARLWNLRVPTLALVPLRPLSIESANFSIELAVEQIEYHQQMQSSEMSALAAGNTAQHDPDRPPTAQPRPWYLVSDPISVRGTLSDPGDGKSQQQKASIKVNVELKCAPTPAGLSTLLTSLTQAAEAESKPKQ